MLKTLGSVFKKKEVDLLIGYSFAFRNLSLGVEEIGTPHELIEALASSGFTPGSLFENIDTAVESYDVSKRTPSIGFSGGPRAEQKIELLESIVDKNYAKVDSYLDELISHDDLEPSIVCMLAATGDLKVLDLVARKDGVFNQVSELGMTPLHWAAAAGNQKVVKFLLSVESGINELSWFFAYPSELAEINGHTTLSPIIAKEMEQPSVRFSAERALERMGCNT